MQSSAETRAGSCAWAGAAAPPREPIIQTREIMLILISDLHLSDCSTASNPHATSIELLIKELKGSIEAKQPTEIHVVLLGDIFDVVRTDYWHANGLPAASRPWGGDTLDPETGMNPDPAVEGQFAAILEKVLAQPSSRALTSGLKQLAEGFPTLPAKVTYVVGNHDRVLNNFESLRARIAAEFSPLEVDFANHFYSDAYRIFARHGHEWDQHCHGWKFLTKVLQPGSRAGRFDPEVYRVMAIGEVVTAELMSGFVFNVRTALPDDAEFLRLVREINNLRPMSDVIRWITWLSRQPAVRGKLNLCTRAFHQALRDTLHTTLAKRWDHVKRDFIINADLTDNLGRALAVLNAGANLDTLQTLIPVFEKLEAAWTALKGHQEDDLYQGASTEFQSAELPADVEYLAYGHTHTARQDCFRAEPDGTVQMYVNTGTFLPLIERAADGHSFVQSNRMTFICLYNQGEDQRGRKGNGPTVDVWDGMKRKDYDE
jgi:UDP-2,3-diacylglucosamine pyrophosphatase LpxH